MSRIYLINIGANTAHSRLARCPLFGDGRFVYVSFPDEEGRQNYPPTSRRFLSSKCPTHTHLDPDWDNLTYGDNCKNPRARALLQAKPNDMLLFWALLWKNIGEDWAGWTGERGWYLVGAIRIEEILQPGDRISKAKPENQSRAKRNAHVVEGRVPVIPGRIDQVFIGFKRNSLMFSRAVDLQIGVDNGLFQTSIRTADGKRINWNSTPRWNSATRSCRVVWDLDVPEQRQRSHLVRDAIRHKNHGFDLLAGL